MPLRKPASAGSSARSDRRASASRAYDARKKATSDGRRSGALVRRHRVRKASNRSRRVLGREPAASDQKPASSSAMSKLSTTVPPVARRRNCQRLVARYQAVGRQVLFAQLLACEQGRDRVGCALGLDHAPLGVDRLGPGRHLIAPELRLFKQPEVGDAGHAAWVMQAEHARAQGSAHGVQHERDCRVIGRLARPGFGGSNSAHLVQVHVESGTTWHSRQLGRTILGCQAREHDLGRRHGEIDRGLSMNVGQDA